jgi:branched-chain amino acid transport system ATP-binding protein
VADAAPGRVSLLATRGLTRRFAGLVAVDGVDLDVPEGGVHALIGPNGAGKTTLFNLISGLLPPTAGRIQFDGAEVTRLPADRRARLGLARTFQNIRIFGAMTLLENVLTGLHPRFTSSLIGTIARLPHFRREERHGVARAREALALVGLHKREGERAAALSYGDQRRLEIARAVVGGPRLLLLDEPAAGMNPAETVGLGTLIQTIVAAGTTVLLVEHDMQFVMNLSDSVTVLNFGRCIFAGAPAEARSDPGVVEAYLGRKVAARLAQAQR